MTEGIGDRAGSQFPLPISRYIDIVDAVKADGKIKGKESFAEVLNREMESNTHKDNRLLDACYEMESIFIGYMLRSMRRTIDESDFLGKSIAKDVFRDMLYDEYAKIMARTDQLGIARQIYNQLSVQKYL